MDLKFVRAVEDGFNRQGRLIVGEARRISVANRLIQGLVMAVARRSDDPLKFLDEVRQVALDLPADELEDVKQGLEVALSRMESDLISERGGQHEVG